MQLPIPVWDYNGQKVIGFTVKKIAGGPLADVAKSAKVNKFQSIHDWNCGCLASFVLEDGEEVTDTKEIRAIARRLPFLSSAHYVAIQGALLKMPDGAVEGVYLCPYCRKQKIKADRREVDGEIIDNRDFVKDLKVTMMPEPHERTWTVELTDPVEIIDKNKGDVLLRVESMTFHHTTIGECINVFNRNPDLINDTGRFQFACWLESLELINGQEVDKSFKSMYGMYIFERITDFDPFNNYKDYGIDPTVTKYCPDCGEFQTEVNTANFFGRALR